MGSEVVVLITAKDMASAKIDGITKLSLGLTAGFAAVGAAAVKMSADYEKEMSGVKAVTQANAEQMKQLSAAALQAGKDTVFSARDAARAESELAKAGLEVSDILGGALAGALDLAAAGQLDVAQAADISAKAMNAFGLEGKDVGHIADVLAAAANKSATDVGELGQGLQQVALVADQFDISLETTVGTLAAFADRGLAGSDGATSLKTALQALNGRSDEAKNLMRDLGIQVYDASGKFVGLETVAGSLQTSLSGLSQEQRNTALQTIFGSDAIRAAGVLYDLGAEGVKEYTDAVNDQGAAARMAEVQTDNLAGDIEALKGSLETLAIGVGSKAIPALSGLTQGAAGAVEAFGGLPESTQATALAMAGVAAAGPAVASGLTKAIDGMIRLRKEGMSTSMALGAWGVGLAAGITAADLALQHFAGVSIWDAFNAKGREAAKTSKEFKEGLEAATSAATATGKEVNSVAAAIAQAEKMVGISAKTFGEAWVEFTDNLGRTDWNRSIAEGREVGEVWEENGVKLRLVADASSETGVQLQRLTDGAEGAAGAFSDSTAWGAKYAVVARDLAEALKAGGATQREWLEARALFAGDAQAAFDETANWSGMVKEWTANAQDAATVLDALNRDLDAFTKGATASSTAVEALTKTSVQEWVEEVTGGFEDAEDAAKALTDTIDNLVGGFSSLNPVAEAARAKHAALTEELGDLKAKGDDLTAADAARIDQLENKLIPAIEAEIKKYDENETAIEGQRKALQTLMGEGGYGALLSVMADAKVAQEDQAYVIGKTSDAYYDLTHDDIPGAIAKFGDLKRELSPEVWQPIAEAIGPALLDAIKKGVADPVKQAELITVVEGLLGNAIEKGKTAAAKADAIGLALAQGIAYGVNLGSSDVAYAAVDIVNTAIGAAAGPQGIDSGSPSKKSRDKLGVPIAEGIAEGIDSKLGAVSGGLIDFVLSLAAAADPVTTPVGVSIGAEVGLGVVEGIAAQTSAAGGGIIDFVLGLGSVAGPVSTQTGITVGSEVAQSVVEGIAAQTSAAGGGIIDFILGIAEAGTSAAVAAGTAVGVAFSTAAAAASSSTGIIGPGSAAGWAPPGSTASFNPGAWAITSAMPAGIGGPGSAGYSLSGLDIGGITRAVGNGSLPFNSLPPEIQAMVRDQTERLAGDPAWAAIHATGAPGGAAGAPIVVNVSMDGATVSAGSTAEAEAAMGTMGYGIVASLRSRGVMV